MYLHCTYFNALQEIEDFIYFTNLTFPTLHYCIPEWAIPQDVVIITAFWNVYSMTLELVYEKEKEQGKEKDTEKEKETDMKKEKEKERDFFSFCLLHVGRIQFSGDIYTLCHLIEPVAICIP